MRNFGTSTLLACAVTFGSSTFAFAACPENNPRPIVSLVEELDVRTPIGDVVDTLGYLEVAKSRGDLSFGDVAQVTTSRGYTGLIEPGTYLSFLGRECEKPKLRMMDIPFSEADDENPLQVKALAGVTANSNRAEVDPDMAERSVRLRKGPSHNATLLDPLDLYTIVFVHSEVQTTEKVNGVDVTELWYYVGTESVLQFGEEAGVLRKRLSQSLRGWVNETDLVFWSQRQAVFLKSASSDNQVYRDFAMKKPWINIPYVDESQAEQAVSILKMPLLRSVANGRVYEVAVPTLRTDLSDVEIEGEENPEPAVKKNNGLDALLAEDTRVLFARLQEKAANLDMLFVMDNSESMIKYREAVIDGISNAGAAVQRFDNLRVAFAMFGDHYNSRAQAEAWAEVAPRDGFDADWLDLMPDDKPFQFWLSDFSWSGELPDASTLTDLFGAEYDDPQNDNEEMGLDALRIAVQSADWNETSVKMVFYIGDDMSRASLGTALVDILKKEQVLLVPINVAGGSVDGFNEDWVKQADNIRDSLAARAGPGGAFPTKITYSEGVGSDTEETRKQVGDYVISLLAGAQALEGSGGIGDKRERAKKLAEKYGVADAQIIEDFFKLSVASETEELEALAQRQDMIQTGYYPKEDANVYVALNYNEFTGLQSAVTAACSGMGTPASVRKALEEMAEELAQAFTGEARTSSPTGEEESIAQFFSRISYLPEEYFSVFGTYTEAEIEEGGTRVVGQGRSIGGFADWVSASDDIIYGQVQEELCASRYLLDAIENNEYIARADLVSTGFDKNRKIYGFKTKSKPNYFDWLWGTPSGINLYFVPQTFFPKEVSAQK